MIKKDNKTILKFFSVFIIIVIGLIVVIGISSVKINPLQAISSNSTPEDRNEKVQNDSFNSNNSGVNQSSVNLDDYRKQVGDIVMAQTLGVSSTVPSIIDDWKTGEIDSSLALDQLKTGKSIFKDSYDQLKPIQPPEGYENVHAKYLKSMELSQNATDDVMNGISTSNHDKFDVALKNLDEANNLIYQANEELDD